MKRRIILLLLVLTCSFQAVGQRRQLDSMLRVLPGMKDDTNKVNLFTKISYSYLDFRKPDSGIYWGEQGLILARRIGWLKRQASIHNSIGLNYAQKNDTINALKNYQLSLKIWEEIGADGLFGRSVVPCNIGDLCLRQDKYLEAREWYLRAEEAARKLNDTVQLLTRINYIALQYIPRFKYSEALEWYYKLVEILNQIDNKNKDERWHYINACLNIGYIRSGQGYADNALEWFQKALKAAELEGGQQEIRLCLNNIAGIHLNNGDLPKALELFLKCLRMSEESSDLEMAAMASSNICFIYHQQSDTSKFRDWAFKALKFAEQSEDDRHIGDACSVVAGYYLDQIPPDPKTAQKWYFKALSLQEKLRDWDGVAHTSSNIGITHCDLKCYDSAQFYHNKALALSRSLNLTVEGAIMRYHGRDFLCQARDSDLHLSPDDKCTLLDSAVFYLQVSISQLLQQGLITELTGALEDLSNAYYLRSDHVLALRTYRIYLQYRDSITNQEKDKKIAGIETRYSIQKAEDSILHEENERKSELEFAAQRIAFQRESERKQSNAKQERDRQQLQYDQVLQKQLLADSLALLTAAAKEENRKRTELTAAEEGRRIAKVRAGLTRQQTSFTVSLGGAALLLLLGLLSFWAYRERNRANLAIVHEQQKSETLLQNVLPVGVAVELKEQGHVVARIFDETSVLFTDFVDFTATAQSLSPQVIVKELHECFSAFDAIIRRNGLEKIKSIGDTYMAVCGLPQSDPKHAQRCVQAATEILEFMQNRSKREKVFKIRIGINSGPVLAGVVGVHKFAYDIWGDTVNTAARMEQHGEAGAINISQSTYDLVNKDFNCSYRGEIAAKNKGEIAMYFVEGKS